MEHSIDDHTILRISIDTCHKGPTTTHRILTESVPMRRKEAVSVSACRDGETLPDHVSHLPKHFNRPIVS